MAKSMKKISKSKVAAVMHEYKKGDLYSSSGQKVTNPGKGKYHG